MRSRHFKPRSNATQWPSLGWIALCATCALSLQACWATLPTSRPASSELPQPPALSTSQPAQPYSSQWQLQADDWQKVVQSSRAKLKATQLMRD